jgi:hypothetical protein
MIDTNHRSTTMNFKSTTASAVAVGTTIAGTPWERVAHDMHIGLRVVNDSTIRW